MAVLNTTSPTVAPSTPIETPSKMEPSARARSAGTVDLICASNPMVDTETGAEFRSKPPFRIRRALYRSDARGERTFSLLRPVFRHADRHPGALAAALVRLARRHPHQQQPPIAADTLLRRLRGDPVER